MTPKLRNQGQAKGGRDSRGSGKDGMEVWMAAWREDGERREGREGWDGQDCMHSAVMID